MIERVNMAILRLHCGVVGKPGFYNSQELGKAKAFAKLNYNITVFLPEPDLRSKEEKDIAEHIKLVYVPCHKIGIHAFFDLSILREYGIQVVELENDNSLFAPKVLRYCTNNNIYVYNYIGTIYSNKGSDIKKWVMRWALCRNIRYIKRYDVVVKNSQLKSELVNRGISEITVAPVGLDLDIIPQIKETKVALREYLDLPQKKKIILCVGRLEEERKPEDALELISRLEDDYCLVMIGDGTMKDNIHELHHRLKLGDRVYYIEKVPNSEIHKYYKACDFYVNFSRTEIWGMSILEAMYQECLVIAYRAPGPLEIIEHGVSGMLTESVSQMCDIIKTIDCVTIKNITQNASKKVKMNFTWDRTAAIINEIINAGRNRKLVE